MFGIQLGAGEESPRVILTRPGGATHTVHGTYADGELHPGVWRVKVTVKARGATDTASRRYAIR